MSWDVKISHLELPDPEEPIISFLDRPGNFIRAIKEKTGISARDWDSDFAIHQLKWFVGECDQGNEGIFNDDWCIGLKDRDMESDWDKYGHFYRTHHSYSSWTGQTTRNRMRESAIRFLLYYIAGYKVEFTW